MEREMDFIKYNRNIKWFLAIVIVCIAFFCVLIYFSYACARSYQAGEVTDNGLVFHIDEARVEGNHATINGWALMPGTSIGRFNSSFVLMDQRDGSFLSAPTSVVIRKDVTKHRSVSEDHEANYDLSGMKSRINRFNLRKPYHNYIVFIRYENDGFKEFVNTGIHLSYGL